MADPIPLLTLTNHVATFQDDLVAGIRTFFPTDVVTTVDDHAGDFDLKEIQHYAKRSPAIIITIDSSKSNRLGGTIADVLTMHAFIVTRKTTGRSRTLSALIIQEHLLKFLHQGEFGTDERYATPTEVQAKNLFSRDLDEIGITLWLVRWDQRLDIPYTETADTLDDFATFFVTNTAARPTELPGDTEASEQAIKPEIV